MNVMFSPDHVRNIAPLLEPQTPIGEVKEGNTRPIAIDVSIAISLKRIADALHNTESGGCPQGSVLYWLEMIASAANAGRS